MKILFVCSVVLLSILGGCDRLKLTSSEDDEVVASVGDKFLYKEDIKRLVRTGVSEDDSTRIVSSYVDKWVKQQLILNKAELNLTDEDKDVSKEIEDYRASLLIFKYEQQYIKEKMDTLISEEEIEEYYNNNLSNFLLDEMIVKGVYLKLPLNSPNLRNVERWYKSNKAEDSVRLADYCFQFATKFDNFDGQWISFRSIQKQLPNKLNNKERYLKYEKTITDSDSLFQYYVYIKEYKPSGEQAPMAYIKNDIEAVLLNKNKISLLNELQNNIYNTAVVRNQIKIYTK